MSRLEIGSWVRSRSRKTPGKLTAIGDDGRYLVEFPPPDGTIPLPESDLTPIRSLLDRLTDGDLDRQTDFSISLRAQLIQYPPHQDSVSAMTNSRLEVLPHQVFVTHRVTEHIEPRFILADEVGLGKTIEAGLIFKEMKARGLARRALVVVPASLVSQWHRELETKFNERFIIYNTEALGFLSTNSPNENPWLLNDQVICSLQFARNQARREQLEDVEWDFVIVDEAHHLRRYLESRSVRGAEGQEETRTTQTYRLGELLAVRTASLLLLTATPLQLHDYELFSLAELVDPTLFHDYARFVAYRPVVAAANDVVRTVERLEETKKTLPDSLDVETPARQVSALVHSIDRLDAPGEANQSDLRKLQEEAAEMRRALARWSDQVLEPRAGGQVGHPNLAPLHSAAETLRQRHKLARIMIRNRKRRAMPEVTTSRHAKTHLVDLRPEEKRFYSLVSRYVTDRYALAKTSRDNALGFVMVTFQKMLASSSRALTAALERRREKLSKGVDAIRYGAIDDDVLESLADTLESADDIDEFLGRSASLVEDALDEEIAAIDELLGLASELPNRDSKLEVLLDAVNSILRENPEEKVLVFTQFIDTQRYIADALTATGHRTELFNGRMSGPEKDVAVQSFRNLSQVMISTEAGGEGRNLQFCHIMFNYDLPWNPMKIEQRIGRLDRIGQHKDVYIYNFAAHDTLEGRILDVLASRINVFEEAVGALDPILGDRTEQEIKELILGQVDDFDRALDRFQRSIEEQIDDVKMAGERLADLIMDSSSFRREAADDLLGHKRLITSEHVRQLTLDFLGRYPTSRFEEVGDGVYKIEPAAALLHQAKQVFGISLQIEYDATFRPEIATEEETLDFVALGHPLLEAVLRFACQPNDHFSGSVVAAAVRNAGFNRNGFLFVYLLEFSGGVEDLRKITAAFVDSDGEPATIVGEDALLAAEFEVPTDVFQFDARSVADAAEEAERLVLQEQRNIEPAWRDRNSQAVGIKRSKIERLSDYRMLGEKRTIRRSAAQIERFRNSDDPAQRRAVPLFEGQLREAEHRLERVANETAEELAELETKATPVLHPKLIGVAAIEAS